MIKHRVIKLNISEDEALNIIQRQLHSNNIVEDCSNNHFILYRTLNKEPRGYLTFRLSGTIANYNDNIILSYTIMPISLTLILSALLFLSLLHGLFKFITGTSNLCFIIVGIVLNLVHWIGVWVQLHIHCEAFEHLFK